MTYEEKKKLIEAAKVLKEHCGKHYNMENCECVFDRCGLRCTTLPKNWDIPEPKRWSPEDVALAKALKAVGATEIYSTSSGRRSWRDDDRNGGILPEFAFKNMEYMEVVRIDDIIKEAE